MHWSGVEEMQAVVRRVGLPLELLQLEGGVLGGDGMALAVGPLRLLRLRLDRRLHSWGPKPIGQLTIALNLHPQPGGEAWRAHGLPLPSHCLFGMDSRREVHLTLPQAVQLGIVLVPHLTLHQWAERLGWRNFEGGECLLRPNFLPLDAGRWGDLRSHLAQLFQRVKQQPGSLALPAMAQRIEADLMPLLVEALVAGVGEGARLERPPARIEVVKQVQDWIHDHPHEPTTLADLCERAHISRRTLIQGFRDHLGMGPMAYLKIHRLHGVRRQLLAADPQHLRVGNLASEWGFLNAGHFARDYRHLFGELPRDTLRTSPPPAGGRKRL
jgi:AraC family ethanolamine operon transcriptional activator